MTQIFISYRRDDDPHAARNIYSAMRKRFGKKRVYLDVEANKAGLDFRRQLEDRISLSDVMLVVIGDNWLQSDETGRSRLEDPADFVRIEIASALKREIPVIPVLVGKASMPDEENLPEDLKGLVFMHAAEVKATADFDAQIERLVEDVRSASGVTESYRNWWPKLAAIAVLVAVGGWMVREFLVDQSGKPDVGTAGVTNPVDTEQSGPGNSGSEGSSDLASSSTASQSLSPKPKMAAFDDYFELKEDTSIEINVLSNDRNLPPAESFGLNFDDRETTGTVKKLDNHLLQYTPAPEFSGRDGFEYEIVNDQGEIASASVRMQVEEVNDEPQSSISDLTVQYPLETILILDVLASASDADGDSVKLVEFEIEGQQKALKSAAEDLEEKSILLGALSREEKQKLDGVLLLPVFQWVKEEHKSRRFGSFSRRLNYTLEDEKGASRSFSALIEVEVGNVLAVGLKCNQSREGGPRSTRLDLLLDEKLMVSHDPRLSRLDDYGFSGFNQNLTVTHFFGDIRINAAWDSASWGSGAIIVTLECQTRLVFRTMGEYPLGAVTLQFSKSKSSLGSRVSNLDFFTGIPSYKKVFTELTGRSVPD